MEINKMLSHNKRKDNYRTANVFTLDSTVYFWDNGQNNRANEKWGSIHI